MTAYNKLSGDSAPGIPKALQDLSNSERVFEQRLKELRRLIAEAGSKPNKLTHKSIVAKQDELINLANEIRILMKTQVASNQKQMFDKLKKHAEALFKQYSELESSYQADDTPVVEDYEVDPEFVERDTMVFKNADELDSDRLKERHEDIQGLQKDFHEVNSLFKEVASMVDQQGNMLDESEKNVDTAVTETKRANVELDSANKYQRSAKKKALIIFIIVLVVVGALIGAVVAATS